MTNKQREARRKYRREWQKKNRERCKEYQMRYWTKRAKEMRINGGTSEA